MHLNAIMGTSDIQSIPEETESRNEKSKSWNNFAWLEIDISEKQHLASEP
jgi:hypothetical protein